MISKWLITSLFAAGQGEVDEDFVRMLVDMAATNETDASEGMDCGFQGNNCIRQSF